MRLSTFSIAGHDGRNGDLGVAVASKFIAVGAVVPWAQAGVGAVATQSYANTSFGPRGLRLLKRGLTPREAGRALLAHDKLAGQRQFGVVDARGRAYSYTGKDCFDWAGGIAGKGFAAQGNILVGRRVVEAMAEAFRAARGLALAERLLAALAAGDAAGGDRRGRQGAALLVVRLRGGYGGYNDRYIDLRVDEHPRPVDELGRLLGIHQMYFSPKREEDRLPIDADLARELQTIMRRQGHAVPSSGEWDTDTQRAFREFAGTENLEERLYDGPWLDRIALEYIRGKFG